MERVFPDYYKDFECIKGECRHSCCIGWEIDIDEKTAAYYKNAGGEFGKRLRDNISEGETPHFILGKNERCPFLNEKGLCDIIINLGDESLCSICDLHPRFVNELPERVETGLGLCCEAASRLILGRDEPMKLEGAKEECADEIIILRDKAIKLLQNRNKDVFERFRDVFELINIEAPEFDLSEWTDILLSLERLDEKWTDVLTFVKENSKNADFKGFDGYMKDRKHEFEQLAVYFIYRHFANAPDTHEAAVRAVFAFASCETIYTIGAVCYTKQGKLSFEDICEIARLYSSEIEYSEDNLYSLFDEIAFMI
ncbi:MAG: hypothetical protein E7660_02580 [Ruminococcaceae bacterium]|nr:hypothetical protein [Oscillospiraceae bacterium]